VCVCVCECVCGCGCVEGMRERAREGERGRKTHTVQRSSQHRVQHTDTQYVIDLTCPSQRNPNTQA
jgi:hypothetical protein